VSAFWNLERHGDAVAFVQEDGRAVTFAGAARDADAFSRAVGGSRRLLFLLCDNDLASVTSYLACLRSGHAALLLPAGMEAGMFQALCRQYRPDFVWRKPSDPAGEPAAGLEPTGFDDRTPLGGGLALLLTTSGSTGSPKLVRLTAANLDANAASICEYLALTPAERAITVLPIHYSYGLSVVNSHLRAGGRTVLTNASAIEKAFWSLVREQEVTSLVGVPYTYAMYRRIGLLRMDLPSLRTMTQAGGRLAPETVCEFATWARSRGIRFFVMYGQTEATARMSYLPPERALERSASVGRAIPGGCFAILDAEGREIGAAGVDGELVYRGPNVSLGYAECREDLAKGDENRGVLHTGDVARYDGERLVYITGRLKRFIKLAGNRVGLDELEALFRAAGIEAYCGGRDDRLCVAVLREADAGPARRTIEEKLALHPTMYRLVVVPDVPRNDAGKVQYAALFRGVEDA
jgi:acyl-CoA synthetase (AMP-forming)/AMP-acid ligase II